MVNSILNGVVPVALLIVFGFGLGKLGVFEEAAPATLSKFIITIALPVDLFVAATPHPTVGTLGREVCRCDCGPSSACTR